MSKASDKREFFLSERVPMIERLRLRASPPFDCNKEPDYQPNCRGNDASPSRPPNLNRNFIARKTLNQRSSCVQIWQEVPSIQKIGNHDRHLARKDPFFDKEAVSDPMEKPGNAENDWLFNGNSQNLKSGESPKSGEQETLLRLQDLGNRHNLWPAKFWTTHPFDLMVKNRFCKPSLLNTFETARISNRDQHHTLDGQLKSHHIHLLALSGTIGTGLFLSSHIHKTRTLLVAFTLISLIVWPFMCCLGELAAQFPMGLRYLRQILHQTLSYYMIFLGAACSIHQIRCVVAGKRFLADEELGYVFGLSCITFGVGLYYTPNILKAISSIMSGFQSLSQTCMERCTNSLLGHRSSRSRSHARQALTMSLLLWTTPVTATAPSHSTNTPSPYSSFLLALSIESGKLFSLFTNPQPPFPRTIPPSTLLLALLLTTSLLTILYTRLAHNNNTSTKYLLCTSVCLALLLGSVSAVDVVDLVFRYLFPGVGVSLMISAIINVILLQRFSADEPEKKVLEQEKKSIVDIDIDIEGGNMKDLDAAEEKRSSMLY